MIGNKMVLVPRPMYSKTSKSFLFMICTITQWQVVMNLIRRMVGTFPCSRTKSQMFLFYVPLGMPEGTILHPNAKQMKKKMRGRGEEEETERGEGREGTLIINATGHRPFKIFKIKKKKILLSTRTFHVSSFLQFFTWLLFSYLKKIQSNSTS